MQIRRYLDPILRDERLTRGLHDPEARILVEWLVGCAEDLARRQDSSDSLAALFHRLVKRARSIGLFVKLWCHLRSHAAACQLAATERFTWPLPPADMDPCDLMTAILACEPSIG